MCILKKKIHTHTKVEVTGGMGVQAKKPPKGEYGYFLELHNLCNILFFNGGIQTLHTLVGDKWLRQSPRTGSTKLPYIEILGVKVKTFKPCLPTLKG